jgi:hypothetical protein
MSDKEGILLLERQGRELSQAREGREIVARVIRNENLRKRDKVGTLSQERQGREIIARVTR